MSHIKRTPHIMAIFVIIIIIFSITGCNTSKSPETTVDKTPSISTPSPTQSGKTETFSYNSLKIKVTNVRDIQTESMIDDGGNPWEYSVFVCYPGAIVTVLDADMSDARFSADGKPHANWGVNLVSGDRIDIVDNMDSFEVTPDILGIYDLESSLYVLRFEMCENDK